MKAFPIVPKRLAKRQIVPLGLLLLSLPITFLLLPQPGASEVERVLSTQDGMRGGDILLRDGVLYSAQRIDERFCIVARSLQGRPRIIARLERPDMVVTRLSFQKDAALCLLRIASRSSALRGSGLRALTPSTKYMGEYLTSSTLGVSETREILPASNMRREEPLFLWRIPLQGGAATTVSLGDKGYAATDSTTAGFVGDTVFVQRPSPDPTSYVASPTTHRYERGGDSIVAWNGNGKPIPPLSESVFSNPMWNSRLVGWMRARIYPDRARDFHFIWEDETPRRVNVLKNYSSEAAPVLFQNHLYWIEPLREADTPKDVIAALAALRVWSTDKRGEERHMLTLPRFADGAVYPLRLMSLKSEVCVLVARARTAGFQWAVHDLWGRPMEYGLLPLSRINRKPQITWLPAPYQGQECFQDGGFVYFVVPETRKNWSEMFSETTTAQMVDTLYRIPFTSERSSE